MTNAAQLALLSKLDSTDPVPYTIWIFTANDTERLERRFLSRCKTLEFSSYGMAAEIVPYLDKVWHAEGGDENIERAACTEEAVEDHLARKAEDAGAHHRRADHGGGFAGLLFGVVRHGEKQRAASRAKRQRPGGRREGEGPGATQRSVCQ